jgi:hypothetical protein
MSLHSRLDRSSFILRALSTLMRLWPIALVAFMFLSPVTPHFRWSYQYIEHGYERHYILCNYLSVKGLITPDFAPDCPFLALIDIREWQR